ncbi:MAG: FecR domain-containing protein [Bryobacterales bacterium]|nr:FecR domain-containing protein [Bryobacterales bacterium]MBV9399848.1 FecR domain-containing protein [Bryobacterales bacterium]
MLGRVRIRWGEWLLLFAVTAGVCLAQFPGADAVNYAAKAVTVNGQVSVLRDSVPWAISAGDLVQVQQVIITGPNGSALFQLSDGSTFEVYPNSRLVFRRTLGDWRDLLDVLVGRIRVHIEHLWGQPNPNRVITPTAVISVRGTTFDVEVNDDDETTVVEVEEGSVEVEHALLPRGPRRLGPGESIRVYRNEPIAADTTVDKGTIFRYIIRAVRDWATTMGTRTARVSVPGGSGGGGGSAGDSCKPGMPGCSGSVPAPPPPPPAPPPPPPVP